MERSTQREPMTENQERAGRTNFAATLKKRQQRVQELQVCLARLLEETGYEALLLTLPENLNWFSAGGDYQRISARQDLQAAIFLTAGKRVLLAHETVSDLLMNQDFAELGFQLKERPDQAGLEQLLDEVTRGRKVCSDAGFGRTRSVQQRLAELRSHTAGWFADEWTGLQQELDLLVRHLLKTVAPHVTSPLWQNTITNVLQQAGFRSVEISIRQFSQPPFFNDRQWVQRAYAVTVTASQQGWQMRTHGLIVPAEIDQVLEQGLSLLQLGCSAVLERWQLQPERQTVSAAMRDWFDKLAFPYDWQARWQILRLGYRYPEEEICLRQPAEFAHDNCYDLQLTWGPFQLGIGFWLTTDGQIQLASGLNTTSCPSHLTQTLKDSIIRWNV